MNIILKFTHKKMLLLLTFFCFWINSNAQTRDSLAKNPVMFLNLASKTLKWTEPAEPLQIAGPIYFVGTKGLGSYLISTSKGLILLYTGMPGSGPMIESSIKKLGFKPSDIKYILSGHAHSDHAGGHAYLKKISGAKTPIMSEEKELLESGGKTDFHYGKIPEFWFDPVKADKILHNGDTIKLGEIIMTAYLTPGHTKGDTTWVTDIMIDGQKYNVVFPDGTSINPGYRLVKNPSYAGIENNYRSTLNKLEMLKPDIWLSCHTDFFDFENKRNRAAAEGIKAWIDREGYQKRIAGERIKFKNELSTEMDSTDKTH
ncbi:metallo-beta-lactamase class B [Flavobacterium sp. 270]|uniref:subclass B3 metallo-beta-lactamase n=1 Tax=Flavobacterium sp. 270 TaxID=2512114 RepID=UPI00106503FB|nr:subclass B3 metallo-beta-lactamase [Flavobacterium sp. 270]TDW44288.1 metallo-beta-lactamase class B [Flavobacterium sp. 270]